MDGGVNPYAYAYDNPLRFTDRKGLATTVITVRDYGIGTHSAVHVDNGGDGGPVLYDPAGSYIPSSGIPPGSGDQFYGRDANLKDYIKWQEENGSTVEITKLPTSAKDEAAIIKRADDIGGAAPFGCAGAASGALGGICGLLPHYFFPGDLGKDARGAKCQ